MQKKEILVRDFEQGKAWQFIVVALVVTGIFLFLVISVALWVIRNATT